MKVSVQKRFRFVFSVSRLNGEEYAKEKFGACCAFVVLGVGKDSVRFSVFHRSQRRQIAEVSCSSLEGIRV